MIQKVITEPNEDEGREDAIELRKRYALPPNPLIEEKRNRIPLEEFQDGNGLFDSLKMFLSKNKLPGLSH
ncbi:hypothetical protein [Ruminococcus sp.]|uniref:hypothetical protein n=1 Tax=Ruminococcus sp. TaxID=41978 RepID=UPI00300F5227